jgi:hypothetical protein
MNDEDAEILQIELPHDGQLVGFVKDGQQPATHIQCIRPRTNYRFMMLPAFGEPCAERIDLPLLHEFQELVEKRV